VPTVLRQFGSREGLFDAAGQESWDERTRRINDHGRREHRRWVGAVFTPFLPVVVATDVYTWKLLRRTARLPRPPAPP
jgi:AcrR family transcriptional regulator